MNKKRSLFLACIMMLFCMSVFGQERNIMIVSGKGQLIDFPVHSEFLYRWFFPEMVLPKTMPRIKTVTVNRIRLTSNLGDLIQTDDKYTNMFYYNSSGRIDSIDSHVFIYENNKIVGHDEYGGKWKYKYDDKGLLKSFLHKSSTYECTTWGNGNISHIKEFRGSSLCALHRIDYNENGRKILYMETDTDGYIIQKITWDYDKQSRLIKIQHINYKKKDAWNNVYVDKCYEYRFEYGTDGNPKRCVEYEIGDIEVVKGGYDLEYVYTFYPTKEELLILAEQKRIADSIQEVERKRLQAEQQRIDSLKTAYSSCKYLFKTETHFTSCMKKEQADMELEIMKLIDNKVLEIFTKYVKTGKELRDPYGQAHIEIKRIRYICNNVDNQSITSHTEDELAKFIASYKTLTKAYKKAVGKKPSEFLFDYMNKK